MKKVFADTFYWVALINLRDQWRNRALEVSANLPDVQIVTSDEVLTETLNYFAESIEFLRQNLLKMSKLFCLIKMLKSSQAVTKFFWTQLNSILYDLTKATV